MNYEPLSASLLCIKDAAFVSFVHSLDLLRWLYLLKIMLLVVNQQFSIIV